MKCVSKITFGVALVVLPGLTASATGMQEPPRSSLQVQYENGDSAEVACPSGSDQCSFHLLVNSKAFTFGAKELLGLNPIPEGFYLFSGLASGRDAYFSFHVRVDCPSGYTRRTLGRCYVSALVQEGKLSQVMVVDY